MNASFEFAVSNLVQKTLFAAEIKGQLSDGAWENTRPWEHWKTWCAATVIVDDSNIGRDFYTPKDNYNLTGLIQYVGDRMLAYGRLAIQFPALVAELIDSGHSVPDSEWDFDYYIAGKHDEIAQLKPVADYMVRMREMFERHCVDKEWFMVTINNNDLYNEKQLRKDLAAIKVAMKTRRKF